MATGSEKRRYPKRYATLVPVEFLDKAKAKGSLVNLSRDGILVTSKKLKPVNSFVRLVAFLPGVEKGVTINGKVVRHTTVNEVPAMGIQFLELDASHRDIWLTFISTFTRGAKTMLKDMIVPDEEERKSEKSVLVDMPETGEKKESQFILKFKSVQRIEDFFPQDWQNEEFFIRTNIRKQRGDKVLITMIHPQNQTELKLNVIVQKYDKHPVKLHKEGIFFRISPYSPKIEATIKQFLQIESYE